jgi:hypothetical protein
MNKFIFLYIFEKTAQQKALGTHPMTSQWRRGEGGIGEMKYRATHGGGPIGPQLRHRTAFSLLMSSFLGGPINTQAVRKKVARTP